MDRMRKSDIRMMPPTFKGIPSLLDLRPPSPPRMRLMAYEQHSRHPRSSFPPPFPMELVEKRKNIPVLGPQVLYPYGRPIPQRERTLSRDNKRPGEKGGGRMRERARENQREREQKDKEKERPREREHRDKGRERFSDRDSGDKRRLVMLQ